ncbi:peptide deformylase [Falsiroseomonas selenitidurans]|uniref:Peptide deformylase n=1 Tax=Falsiroseomonas selenitidurans TaxID=2716335 RepID=A0ABX1EB02_9PROT|nr:peptide deformylase [Falsiroseomonas selenitidurans]NKC34166.1 peptide deformylase [Falsiroseomonas selenitidurans]
MAILKIARMGHPVLIRPALPVEDPTAHEIRRLVADMAETMVDAAGLGLAAPQVHQGLRLFVWRGGAGNILAIINPEITPVGDAVEDGWEGCLSIPGLRGAVPRAARVHFTGWDIAGQRMEGEAAGLPARVMQHEADHLDGVLYPMRMPDLSRLGFTEELQRAAPPEETAR